MNDTVKQVEETVAKATAAAGEKVTALFKDGQARAQAAFEKSGELVSDAVAFQKANIEAVVASGKLAVEGAQVAAKDAADFGRKNWDATTAFVTATAAAKSPVDFFKLQSEFVRAQFDASVAEFSKASEFALKFAGEVAQPLQNRAAIAGEEIKTRLAA